MPYQDPFHIENAFLQLENNNETVPQVRLSRKPKPCKLLPRANIPTILGLLLEQKRFFKVMEFIGAQQTSSTVHMHKRGLLHSDINIMVLNGKGYLVEFGKACLLTAPPAKKQHKMYHHIAPEVLHGSPCSRQSDVYWCNETNSPSFESSKQIAEQRCSQTNYSDRDYNNSVNSK